MTSNVSFPIGAPTVTVHVVVPPDVVQPGDEDVRSCVSVGTDPFTAIVSDCVLGETYFGDRAALPVAFGGMAIENTALDARVGASAPGNVEPPPPHAARTRIATAAAALFENTMCSSCTNVVNPHEWDIRTMLAQRESKCDRAKYKSGLNNRFCISARKAF